MLGNLIFFLNKKKQTYILEAYDVASKGTAFCFFNTHVVKV